MPQHVRVLFNVGDTVLVNELSPCTQFQLTSSSFDARSSSTTYRLKFKSDTKRIIIIVGEENIALASGGTPVNSGVDEPSSRSQESRDNRGLGQMINAKDVERGDTIETTLDGIVGVTRAFNVGNQPAFVPYFEYVNADGINRRCFNQRVRLLTKSTSATRSSCISFEQPPPVYRGMHPHYDELRFEMLGLLHGGLSAYRKSPAGILASHKEPLHSIHESKTLYRNCQPQHPGTPQEKNNMLKHFPPCKNEDFDIDAFEAQVAATDAKEAANEKAYMKKEEGMSGNDEIEYGTPLKEVDADSEQDEAQMQSSRGTSLDEAGSVLASGMTGTALGGFYIGD